MGYWSALKFNLHIIQTIVMKYLFALIVLFSVISCSDDDSIEPIDYDKQNEKEILDYIAKYNLDATKSSTGLYYVIDEKGNGKVPDVNSFITLKYKGLFSDGSVWHETDDLGENIYLQDALLGVKEGLPYFNVGGKGILLLPSRLAFGSEGKGEIIPKGSVIIIEFEFLDIDFENQNDKEILDFIEKNNLDAIKTTSGLYYVVEKEGTGINPNSNSDVTVNYKGYYSDGKVFDQNNNVTFNLRQVIAGWTEGITYFKKGGTGKLLIPSRLGYGNSYHNGIPGGSVLIFDIDLLDVK